VNGGGDQDRPPRVQLRHAGVDQHTPIGMVDDVHVDWHPLALGEQSATWIGVMVIFFFIVNLFYEIVERAFYFVKIEINEIPSLPKPPNGTPF